MRTTLAPLASTPAAASGPACSRPARIDSTPGRLAGVEEELRTEVRPDRVRRQRHGRRHRFDDDLGGLGLLRVRHAGAPGVVRATESSGCRRPPGGRPVRATRGMAIRTTLAPTPPSAASGRRLAGVWPASSRRRRSRRPRCAAAAPGRPGRSIPASWYSSSTLTDQMSWVGAVHVLDRQHGRVHRVVLIVVLVHPVATHRVDVGRLGLEPLADGVDVGLVAEVVVRVRLGHAHDVAVLDVTLGRPGRARSAPWCPARSARRRACSTWRRPRRRSTRGRDRCARP